MAEFKDLMMQQVEKVEKKEVMVEMIEMKRSYPKKSVNRENYLQ